MGALIEVQLQALRREPGGEKAYKLMRRRYQTAMNHVADTYPRAIDEEEERKLIAQDLALHEEALQDEKAHELEERAVAMEAAARDMQDIREIMTDLATLTAVCLA